MKDSQAKSPEDTSRDNLFAQILEHLPADFQLEFAGEMIDYLSDAIEDAEGAGKSRRWLVIFETVQLIVFMWRKRLSSLGQLLQESTSPFFGPLHFTNSGCPLKSVGPHPW